MTDIATAMPSMLTRCVLFEMGQARDRSRLGCLTGFGGAHSLTTTCPRCLSQPPHYIALWQNTRAPTVVSRRHQSRQNKAYQHVFHIIRPHALSGVVQCDSPPRPARCASACLPTLARLPRDNLQVGACPTRSIEDTGARSGLGTRITKTDSTARDLEHRRF